MAAARSPLALAAGVAACCPPAGKRRCAVPNPVEKAAQAARDARDFVGDLARAFGWRFLVMQAAGEHLLKGALLAGGGGGLVYATMTYAFRAMAIPSARFTALSAACTSPWSLKPLLGFANDALPLLGFRLRWYFVVTCLVGTASFAALAAQEALAAPLLPVVCAAFFLVVQMVAWTDLMCESAYTERMRDKPEHAPALLSFVWGGINAFGLIGVGLAGPLIGAVGPFRAAAAGIPFALLPTLPAALGWLGETRVDVQGRGGGVELTECVSKSQGDTALDEPLGKASLSPGRGVGKPEAAAAPDEDALDQALQKSCTPRSTEAESESVRSCPPLFSVNMCAIREHGAFFASAALLAVSSLATTLTTILYQAPPDAPLSMRLMNFWVALAGATISGLGACLLLPTTVSRALLFFLLSGALNLYASGPVFYFYTDGPDACPSCPHFSATFYTTVVGIADAVFSLIGVYLFNRYMSNWSFRSALVVTELVSAASSIFDIIQFNRWISPDPIPDEVFMLGKAAVQNSLAMLHFLPGSLLLSRLCPRGAETVAFSLLAGFSNFGTQLASYAGAALIEAAFPTLAAVDGTPLDDFRDLWKVALIATAIPLLGLVLVPLLVPSGPMNARLEQ